MFVDYDTIFNNIDCVMLGCFKEIDKLKKTPKPGIEPGSSA